MAGTNDGAGAQAARKMKKREAVRQSLAFLGKDAKPQAMLADIRERFGIEMTTDHISTEKGILLRQKKAGRKPGRPRGSSTQEQQPAAPAPRQAGHGGSGSSVPVEDVVTLKALVKRNGAGALRTLLGVLEG